MATIILSFRPQSSHVQYLRNFERNLKILGVDEYDTLVKFCGCERFWSGVDLSVFFSSPLSFILFLPQSSISSCVFPFTSSIIHTFNVLPFFLTSSRLFSSIYSFMFPCCIVLFNRQRSNHCKHFKI